MNDEDAELRRLMRRYISDKKSERLRTNFSAIGGIASVVALIIVLIYAGQQLGNAGEVVVAAEDSLKITCAEVDQTDLPARVKEQCKKAENNELSDEIRQAPLVDNPDPDDPESQEGEIQDPEIQGQETQDNEIQDPEIQDPELQESENQDPDEQETEIQDPEIQDDEVQDPEIDDPSIPGPQGPAGPPCPDGYTVQDRFVEGNPMTTEDDETWRICVRNS
jgi:hypothetical protein